MCSLLQYSDLTLVFPHTFGAVFFDAAYCVIIPLQNISDDHEKEKLKNVLRDSDHNGGFTSMFVPLNYMLKMLKTSSQVLDTWIVCLTDGASCDYEQNEFRTALCASSSKLNLSIIGVNLHDTFQDYLHQVCSKFGTMPTQGIFVPSQADAVAMDHAFGTVAARIPVSQTFELDGALTNADCQQLMRTYLPSFVPDHEMLHKKFWIEFLYRRVKDFDENEDFNYNEKYDTLGSSLMQIMLHEAEELMSPRHNKDWKTTNQEQLIYHFTNPDAPEFLLICTAPEYMSEDAIKRFESLDLPGFYIPKSSELRERKTLDRFLSQALGVPIEPGSSGALRLSCINDSAFVLTIDFAMKLLSMNGDLR